MNLSPFLMKKSLMVLLLLIFVCFSLQFASAQVPSTLPIEQEALSRSFGEVGLPETVAQPIRFLFQIPATEDVTITYFIILIAVSIFILIAMFSLIKFVPFFSGWRAWAGAIVITLITAISGGAHWAALLFLSIRFLPDKWGSIFLVFVAFVLIILGLGLAKLLKIVRDKVGVETSRKMGLTLSVQPLMQKLRDEGIKP